MKKIFSIVLLFSCLLAGFFQHAYAVKAYPYPIQVTQPDGSVITLQKHGDEFLNWTTSGGRLVKQGADGFYYLAQFSSVGAVQATTNRVRPATAPQDFSTITPPAAAFERARPRREDFSRIFAGRSHFSRLNMAAPAAQGSLRSMSSGNKKFLVILVQFSDNTFTSASPRSDFFNLLNLDGYAENGATGSAWNYFRENSSETFNPQFDVVGPVTLSRNMAYYGANVDDDDVRPREMVTEAVDLADQQLGVDFSQYDNDGDGYIDNIFIYYAGYNEAEGGPDNTIWPHAWSIYNQRTVDGVKTGSYACSSELRGSSGSTMAGIGTFCHEFGHVIGLPDFYDTDYEDNGEARGLGSFSLMSNGNYNNNGRTPPYLNSIERDLLGWFDNEPGVIEQEGDYTLEPVFENSCYVSETTNEGETFLYEYRKNAGWDAFIPSGLLIYHIDKSDNLVGGKTAAARWNDWDGINAYASHQCCDLVEAVYPESTVQNDSQVPFPGSTNNTSFTGASSPAAVDHAGNPTGTDLTNIVNTGDRATFTIFNSNQLVINGVVSDPEGNPVAGATVILSYGAPDGISPAAAPQGNPAGAGSIKASPKRALEQITEVTTNAQGAYTFTAETATGRYIVTVSKQDYHTAEKEVSGINPGTVQVNFTLYPVVQITGDVLRKHNAWEGSSIGFGQPGGTIYGAVGFSAEELVQCQGKRIKTVSFQLSGNTAAEAGIFVTMGTDVVLNHKVNTPVFGTMMTVDVSEDELIIPEGKLVKIGCYVKDSDSGYPIAIDEGPMVPMGGYASDAIAKLTEPWSLDYNILVSATVEEVPILETAFSGRVTDEQGAAVAGVTMSLFYDEAATTSPVNSSGLVKQEGPFRTSPLKTGSLITTVVTNQEGEYTFSTVSRKTGTFIIQASKTGYYQAVRQFPANQSGAVTALFTIIPVVNPGNGVLKKHGLWTTNIGSGNPGETIYGAVGFSAQDMAPYAGYVVNTISCLVNGSSALEVGVFACIDQEYVLTQVVSNPSFGTLMNVDVSGQELVIPDGKQVLFGYYVKGSDSAYPLAADDGPMVPMGGYARFTIGAFSTDWKEQYDLDHNIMVSATLGPRDNQLFSSGYYMIKHPDKAYKEGDIFRFELNDSPLVEGVTRPSVVQWYFNGQAHSATDVITLTAGSHTIMVVLTFATHSQTIVKEILVGK